MFSCSVVPPSYLGLSFLPGGFRFVVLLTNITACLPLTLSVSLTLCVPTVHYSRIMTFRAFLEEADSTGKLKTAFLSFFLFVFFNPLSTHDLYLHGQLVQTWQAKCDKEDSNQTQRCTIEHFFSFFCVTLSMVLCCGFFLVTNVFVVIRFWTEATEVEKEVLTVSS